MTQQKFAYMAAIIEAKGRIKMLEVEGRASPQLTLRYQSQQVYIVKALCEYTGSEVNITQAKSFNDNKRAGCTEHCPEKHVHYAQHMPQTAHWQIVGAGAAIVLYNLMPYMAAGDDSPSTAKFRRFVDVVCAWQPASNRGAYTVKQTVERLHKLGWKIPAELEHYMNMGPPAEPTVHPKVDDEPATERVTSGG